MNWATTEWTCVNGCDNKYDHDLSWCCCNPWYDRSVKADPYEE